MFLILRRGTHPLNRKVYKVWVCVYCMETTLVQTSKRAKRIKVVEDALRDIQKRSHILDMTAFVIYICERFACSDRTAKEYIKIAESRIK